MATWRALTTALGVDLALLCGAVMAQVVPTQTMAVPVTVMPVQVQQTITVLLFVLAMTLGAAVWACRPDDLMPPAPHSRNPTLKAMISSYGWGALAVFVGFWKGWNPWPIATAALLSAMGGHFLTVAFVWIGRNFAKNPMTFIRRWQLGGAALDEEQQANSERTKRHRANSDTPSGGWH